MRCHLKGLASIVLALFTPCAMGCLVPPFTAMREPGALLGEARAVVLVEAVTSTDRPSECSLRVLRSWKASAPTPVPVKCRLPEKDDLMTDFTGHSDWGFWKTNNGRLGTGIDCSVKPPAFAPGKRYLIFIGIAPDTKQYEQIANADDRWLQFVESHLSAAN